jgi:hypothetical protein
VKPTIVVAAIALAASGLISGPHVAAQGSTHADLVALFSDWRAFQRPRLVDGVPDYTSAAMAAQQRELPAYQRRLAAIKTAGWPVNQQADWHILRAEMNGLDFDHRVIRPWANNPAFYVSMFPGQSDQPAREGHFASGAIELWSYQFPLSADSASRLGAALRGIPNLLDQARRNLAGDKADLWTFGTQRIKQQSMDLERLSARVGDTGTLRADVQRAREATDAFARWLDAQAPSKRAHSGVGVENYDWYLKNVQLVPYTWQDEVTIMQRELARAHSSLALEEQRNAALPVQTPIRTADDFYRQFNESVTAYMAFLKNHDILTVRDYMDPALRARIGTFNDGPREFFAEIDYRDRQIMRTHDYHWFDLAQMSKEPHPDPIRRGALLYNIFITRTEGHATGWEELMLQAGMFDARPRSRELIYVLLGQRAARALGDLRMHANQMTLEQAAAFAVANTPRGWLRLDANTVRSEQHLYLQQPAYGPSYIIGKIQVEGILTARRRQLGDAFSLKRFMDEFNAVGLIPASLVHWELTGEMPAGMSF